MSICRGIGNGIGGALGKWGAGLGSALGLGTAVDLGVRAYTGYGLLETLNVPYIECPDGSFATAIEWYGSGLKCPKKAEPVTTQLEPVAKTGLSAGEDYNQQIEALGGAVFPYVAYQYVSANNARGYDTSGGWREANSRQTDKWGNLVKEPTMLEGRGDGQVYSPVGAGEGFGGWGGSAVPAGITYQDIRNTNWVRTTWNAYKRANAALVGIRISLPELPVAPPTAFVPPPPGFAPRPPSPPDKCEMSCPCISPQQIEAAVKKALGVAPFSPEKLMRELGTKMFAAPGPSVIPIVPTSFLEAIAALIATNYMRSGFGRYPVVMPGSMIAGENPLADAVPTLAIENQAEWIEWIIKQQDAVQGEWPIDIKIIDGAKRQPLKFENISEAFAEVTGLLIQTATDADAAVSVASHAAVAATKAQTAAVIAQKNAECIIKFFGVRTGYGSIFVDSAITPMDSDSPNFNLKKFLTPSKQSIAFYTDNDPFDFQATMDRILRNSEIAKAAVAMDASKEIVGDYARNQRKYDTAEAKREAEKELEKLETSLKTQNPDIKLKIRVDTPAAGEILGNNFVIKRPESK